MLAAVEPLARRLDPDQLDPFVIDEIGENADRVRSPADAGDDRVGKPALNLENLLAGFLADDPLKLAHHQREGVRPRHRAKDIVRIGKARGPVAQRLVDRVLERLAARSDRDHLGPHQLHPEHVERLPRDIVRAHVDLGLEPEQRAGQRGRDAVLTRAGLGDQPGLAHAFRQQPLRQHLVGLVRAAVKQILALEVNPRPLRSEVATLCQRSRPPGIGGKEILKLRVELGVALCVEERRLELLQRGDEDLGHKGPAEATEPTRLAHLIATCWRGGGR